MILGIIAILISGFALYRTYKVDTKAIERNKKILSKSEE
jgi:hypothetical protein